MQPVTFLYFGACLWLAFAVGMLLSYVLLKDPQWPTLRWPAWLRRKQPPISAEEGLAALAEAAEKQDAFVEHIMGEYSNRVQREMEAQFDSEGLYVPDDVARQPYPNRIPKAHTPVIDMTPGPANAEYRRIDGSGNDHFYNSDARCGYGCCQTSKANCPHTVKVASGEVYYACGKHIGPLIQALKGSAYAWQHQTGEDE